MTTTTLHYGQTTLSIDIPPENLGEIISPRSVQTVVDPLALIQQAIDEPIGTPRLQEMVQADQTVALIVDDLTRSTPAHLILPILLEQLATAGVKQENIAIVLALGTHRPMTEKEVKAKVGPDIMATYTIINTSSEDTAFAAENEALVYMGTSSNGIPAWVKPAVAQADVKIGVGQITPHMDAGYSGGAKIILPGVCSTRTVEAFHAKETDLETNQLGNLDSPIRQDLEQFVGDCVGLDFIVNIIMTPDHKFYQCVAGHFIEAHRVGVRYAQEVYGVPVKRRYPIVIANAYPKDMDLWQSTTAIWAGERLVESGGTLIVLTNAWDKHSAYPDFPQRIGADADELKRAFDADELPNRMTAIFGIGIGRFKRRFQISLVSQGLTQSDAEIMGFAYHETLEGAIAEALSKHGQTAKITILTHGAITLPTLA